MERAVKERESRGERVVFRTARLDGRTVGSLSGALDHLVLWLSAGRIVLRSGPVPILAAPGAPVILSVGERAAHYEAWDAQLNILEIADDLVRECARSMGYPVEEDAPLQFRQQLRRSDLARFGRLLHAVGPRLASRGGDPANRARLERLLAEGLLNAFLLEVPVEDRVSQRQQALVEFVAAHAGEDLTVGDIAHALGIHVRTLQEHCRRVLGVSPMDYLRDARLDNVRRELIIESPATTTVAAVARRCGFRHVGRFSGYYAGRFGEQPSETLRNRRIGP
jgi:AraC-like DNA-binding protein